MAGSRDDYEINPRLLRAIERERKKVCEKNASLSQVSPPHKVYDRDSTSSKTNITLPSFAGKFDPDAYVDWEIALDKEFEYYEWSDRKKIRAATSVFC